MAYRFRQGESIPQNVKRIAREELGAALRQLRGKGTTPGEESVHEVRKSIKKMRALLRLVRPQLGDFFADENVRLRDTGHRLSQLRDAGALIGVVDNLRKRPQAKTAGKALSAVRRRLNRQKLHIEEDVETRRLKPELTDALRQTQQSIRYWPLETDGFPAIAEGLERTFRDGREAMARARKTGRREDFHEWRKRVKDHWYQVRLLQKVWGDVMVAYESSLKELENALGEDLNLAILSEHVESMASENGFNAASLGKTIDAARKELRERALEIGARIYAEKPREFLRQIKRLWKVW
ncbi:MAG: CHAD domain-containing protein [Ignavibacteriota bacterium]